MPSDPAPPPRPGAVVDGEAIAHLTELLRSGMETEAEAELDAFAAGAQAGDGAGATDSAPALSDRAAQRRAVLDAIIEEPYTGAALRTLEDWLDGTVDATAAVPLASSWGLPAAGLDLEVARAEARLYIDAYPMEARVLGDMNERAATWLVARLAQTVAPAERLPAVRRAITSLAEAASPVFPSAAASLRAVAEGVEDQSLWYQVAVGIVQAELQGGFEAAPS